MSAALFHFQTVGKAVTVEDWSVEIPDAAWLSASEVRDLLYEKLLDGECELICEASVEEEEREIVPETIERFPI